MRFPLYLLLCTVFLLKAAIFVDLALYLAVYGLASVELSCSLTTLVLQARLAPIPRLPILVVWSCSRSLSLSLKLVFCRLEICNFLPGDCAAVCSRSASLHPATELRPARGRASVCSGPCCGSSSGPSVNLDLFLKLPHVEEFPGCPRSIWVISCVELERQILWLFTLRSHAPCVTERQCLYSFFHDLAVRWRNGESSVQVRSFTILLFASSSETQTSLTSMNLSE